MAYKPKVSFNLIARNEEANIERCLASVKDLVDEMIVVDTGSTDRTKEIALAMGAKVFDFKWCDSFAAARNEALGHSSGDWIFWIDADEYFDEENREKVRALFSSLKNENVVYMTSQVNTIESAPGEEVIFGRPSLFRHLPNIRWQYRVHEQILIAIEQSGGRVEQTDIRLMHPGYHVAEVHKKKVERNIRLLHIEDLERPNDPFILFHLGLMYQALKRYAEAVVFWPRVVEISRPGISMVAKAYCLWSECFLYQNDLQGAFNVASRGLSVYPNDPELMLANAKLLATMGEFARAEELIRKLMSRNVVDGPFKASFNTGVYTFHAHSLLGQMYAQEGRKTEAAEEFKKALSYNPHFQLARDALESLGKSC